MKLRLRMKTKQIIYRSLILLICSACVSQNNPTARPTVISTDMTSFACEDPLPIGAPLPDFLAKVHPVGTISLEDYNKALADPFFKGIGITVYASGIDSSVVHSRDSEYRLGRISDRTTLYVDELLAPNDASLILDGLLDEGPFYFSWRIQLEPGPHHAKLVFNTDTKGVVNYIWEFCINP